MASKKMLLGPLPEQTDDFSRYEETVVRWDRIGVAAVVVMLVVGGLGSWVLQGGKATSEHAIVQAPDTSTQTITSPASKEPMAPEKEPSPTLGQASTQQIVDNQVLLAESDANTLNALPATSAGVPADVSGEHSEQINGMKSNTLPPILEEPVISPVSKLHVGIERAELTQTLRNGEPGEPLSYEVAMNDEGIIKVILFTEMEGLRGKTLYHEWYRGDRRMARVRIPVNVDHQSSHSSKFINQQMLGEWRVKVLDDQGELYAEANFKVIEG
ncbi:MAG: DUF2914 domain-containing protein [Oleiphilaceae bacterium]|nr:DUF2914 domain-containing protein [Oleiphilaceae bacterium]